MPTVLLVDDEKNVHEVFEDAMEPGVRVVHASDGMEALKLLEGEEVDLVVTDLTMPNLDGMALLREVRERGVTVPALVLSAHGTVPNVVPSRVRTEVRSSLSRVILLASPKSMTLACPSGVIIMLDGLRSRWTTPALWALSKAWATSEPS